MSIKSGFFNSVNGDREYNADQMSEYFEGLVSDTGVFENWGGAFQVIAGTGLAVNVQTGKALINARWVKSDSVETISLTAAHATLNRYTAIVLELSTTDRTITLKSVDGTPASSPVKPAIVNTATVRQICLAYVLVRASATAVSQSDITDTRPSSLCGWITGLINQVNTSTLFNQWQTAYEEFYATMESWMTTSENQFNAWKLAQQNAFNTWFETLTEQLNVDTYVKMYYMIGHVDSATTNINLNNFYQYDYEYESTDSIIVVINGLVATAETEYRINSSAEIPRIEMIEGFTGDYFVLAFKSKIGVQV